MAATASERFVFRLRTDLGAGQAAGVMIRATMLSDLSALVDVQRAVAVLALERSFRK